MRVPLTVATMAALGACTPYPQEHPAPPVPLSVADPVGLIAAEPSTPATARFPGLLTLAGYGLAGGGVALDTVLVGGPPPP